MPGKVISLNHHIFLNVFRGFPPKSSPVCHQRFRAYFEACGQVALDKSVSPKTKAVRDLGSRFYKRKVIARVVARTVAGLESLGHNVVLTTEATALQTIESVGG